MGYHQWMFSDLYERYVKESDPDLKQQQEEVLLEYWNDAEPDGDVFIDSREAKMFRLEFHL